MDAHTSSFPMARLSEYAEIKPGFAFKSERFTDRSSDLPLVKGDNVQQGYIDWSKSKFWNRDDIDDYREYLLEPGDIVVAMDRPWVIAGLKWAFIKSHDPKSLLVQRVARLRAKEDLSQGFLRCLVSSNYFASYIEPIVTGVNVPHISGKQVGDFRIPLPSMEVQEKISAILAAYDDLIENNKRRITLLENMAEEIYREWFVRFRFPGWQEAEFEKGFPANWRAVKFDEFCKLKRGYDLPDSKVMDGPYPVLASTSVKTFHGEYKVKAPVITTGRSGSLGTVLFKRKNCWPLNTTLYVQNFKGNSPFFIYFTLKNMPLETFNSGAGVPSLNRNHLAGLRVVVPDENAQKEFDDVVEPMFRQVDILQEQSEHLLKTKVQLLPRLISGKLSVENLDIQFPPSMLNDKPESSNEAVA